MITAPPDWIRAQRALAALAIDPAGLGGMVIRARPGPVRQRLEQALETLPLPLRRVHPGLDDIQLFGGLDVAASLAGRGLVRQVGLADHAAALVMPMAERVPPGLAARLAGLLDGDRGHCLVLLDEGADPDETAPQVLTDRLAFHLDLSEIRAGDALLRLPAPADLDAARARLPRVEVPDDHLAQLVHLAARFGIHGLRAPLLALRCARALAALDLHDRATGDHLREAAELVLPSRATQVPEAPDEDDSPDQPQQQESEAQGDGTSMQDIPDELLVEAIAACLPPDLLTRLVRGGKARGGGQGFGAGGKRKGNRRGRPLPSRPGRPDGRARIDVVATLRAAAPWQPLRRAAMPGTTRLVVHPGDLRLRQTEEHSDRLVILAVDSSGSAALARMAEAKGAVELLLAQAYTKRDLVALVTFRDTHADVPLPPTRSLVQAKRRIAALPGGGGTPLAAGLRAVHDLALQGLRNGQSPCLALLTDGRGNIALDGSPGRTAAAADARDMARLWHRLGLPAIVIDTANRPGAEGAELAAWLGARYLALPRADARRISAAADAALSR